MSVGRLVPKKGFDVLIRACGDLRRRGIAFEFVVLGGGELHDELRTLAHEQGIADRVRLLGSRPQSDVVEQLASAELFALSPVVLPNGDRDGIPNVLLEAMAVGLPVVATSVSGIPEVVKDGDTGLLVPPRRPDLLADALEKLLADPAARSRLGEGGRRFVQEHASWTSGIAPLCALLEGELARPAASRRSLR